MKKRYVLIVAICILFSISFMGCKEEIIVADNHIASYTISYLEGEENKEVAEVLQERLENVCDMEVVIEADKMHIDDKLIYVGGEMLAAQTGTDLSAINEEGYLIEVKENGIYIYALNEKGHNRAFNELLEYVDEDGLLKAMESRLVNTGIQYPKGVMVGEADLSEYVIVLPKKSSDMKEEAAQELQYYISEISGAYLPIIKNREYKESQKGILFEDCTAEELINTDLPYLMEVKEGTIRIRCTSEEVYSDSVNAFANTYLGWAYAGSDKEHISTFADVLRIPYDTTFMPEGIVTWMEEREAIVCL